MLLSSSAHGALQVLEHLAGGCVVGAELHGAARVRQRVGRAVQEDVDAGQLAPGVIEDHLTFGFTRGLASGDEVSMSFMYGFNKKVSGTNPLDPSQTISFDMDQWEVEISYGWR